MGAGFVGGGLVGSFLNVVAHRVPRGETVVFGRSRCPACGALIRARHNLPVVGWLLLRGRCHDCGTAIPAHYPIVEAASGCFAAAVALAEFVHADGDPVAAATGWVGRTAVALTLVAWSLLAERGRTAAPRTVALVSLAAAFAAAFVPTLAPMASCCQVSCPGGGPTWCAVTALCPTCPAGPMQCLWASTLGAALGWAIGGSGRAACVVVGAALGWQAAAVAAIGGHLGRVLGWPVTAGPLAAATVVVVARPLEWAWHVGCRLAAVA